MSLEIKPDDINRFVADAILKSALGAAVEKAVGEAISKLERSWDNPIEYVVKQEVSQMVRTVINQTYAQQLRAKVEVAMTGKITDDVLARIIDKSLDF